MKTLCMLLLAIVFSSMSILAIGGTTNALQVSASPIMLSGKPLLKFEVKNTSDSDLTIRKAELPWGASNFALHVDGFGRDEGFELDHISAFDDPEPGEVTIRKGATLIGYANLSDHLKSVKKFLEEEDLVVFWFYKAKTPDNKPLGEYGNWLVFPHTNK